jgi:hypothetical protein
LHSIRLICDLFLLVPIVIIPFLTLLGLWILLISNLLIVALRLAVEVLGRWLRLLISFIGVQHIHAQP